MFSVKVRVKGGRLISTHTCMQGRVSGMRFNEGGRDLVESERVVKQVAPMPHATKRKHLSSVYTTPTACGSTYLTL